MADVFISYQRKQEAIVSTLKERFEALRKDVWVDLDDIPKAADWLQQIERGIEGATSFVCVLTLDYLISEICAKELAHAREHNKQIIPLVRDLDPKTVEGAISGLPWEPLAAENWSVVRALNWIFLRESDDFEKAFQELLTATETDLPFEELRARLTVRAREWVSRDHNTSYVLRGADLVEAEHWLAQGSTKKLGASAEQIQYITSSRKAATARQRVTVGSLSVGLIVATVLAIAAILNGNRAQANFLNSESRRLAIAANAALQADNFDLATLLAIRALRSSYSQDADLTLGQAISQTAGTAFRGHTGLINSIAYSPDGQYGLTGGEDGTARLWQLTTGQEVRRFLTDGSATSVCFSPDGRYVLTGSGNVLQLWDTQTGQMIRDFKGHTRTVLSVAYSPDGRYVLSGSDDRTSRLWDATTGQQLRTFDQRPDNVASVSSVAFAADGRYALTARSWNVDMFDGSARVWDVETGQVLRQFDGQGAALSSIAFLPLSNGLVLTSGADHKARLWNWHSGLTVQIFSGNSPKDIFAAVSPDGQRVLTAGDGILWDAATGVILRKLTEDAIPIEHAAFSPDGRYVLGSIGDHARLWDLQTGAELRRITSTAAPQSQATFSSDGQNILTVDANHTVLVRDLNSNAVKAQYPSTTAVDARFSADGQFIVTMGMPVERWSLTDRTLSQPLAHIPLADHFTLSPDNRYMLLIQGGPAKAVELWSLNAPHLVRILDSAHLPDRPSISVGNSYSMAYAPDGHSIATGNGDGSITLWDLASGTEIRHFSSALDANTTVAALAYSPDGRLLLSGDVEGTVSLWEVATGHERLRLTDLHRQVSAVAFSSDGHFALTIGASAVGPTASTMRLWDTNTGQQVQIFDDTGVGANSAVFSADSRYVLTTGKDGTVRLWLIGEDALVALGCSRIINDLTPTQRTIYGIDNSPTCSAFGLPVAVTSAASAPREAVIPKTTELPPLTLSSSPAVVASSPPTATIAPTSVPSSPTPTLVPATVQLTPVPTHTPLEYFEPLEPPTSEAKG